jgi:ferredoxin
MAYKIYVKHKDTFYNNVENKNIMDILGINADVVPKGCHNGGCGVCKVKVLSGEFENIGMNRKFITKEDELNNIFLACRLKVKSDIFLEFIPKKKKSSVYVLGD